MGKGIPMGLPQGTNMETLTCAQGCFSNSLLLSASILALGMFQSSQAALYIQKIPEQPLKNQDLLLSVQGMPETFQDFNWYQGEKTYGSTMLFSYIPELQRPQRDGNAMGKRDIVGFSNGSMLLRRAQPEDSGIYQVSVTINPSWSMKAKTEVKVAERHQKLPSIHPPMNAGTMAAIIIGSLAAGALLMGSLAYLLVRSWKGQNHRMTDTDKPERRLDRDTEGANIYEVLPSPGLLGSPINDPGLWNLATPPPLPLTLPPEPQNHHYQDLLNPEPAPYCQLMASP
ncbi:PREDICTED: carcinoembryonic antigen-related cell adhesion molecule 19 [Chrysochloris asiatica]|uniref:Carcinoembryonic antigen-related cell adhesion molecule 19 n=1 Tax=Chrysochloris asiatica TaxID=185453 RepID=A0A9B0WXG5_CHRAS|nr:PREDICTED: carcinoembryonic antigen-related cell adhesion molecule 19 [Chrysochloris asiatica]